MRIKLKYPWKGCIGYKVFHKKEGRMMLNIIFEDKSRTTTSYARYKMSVKLKRKLSPSEHVDHIDEDKTNDSIKNLQILTNAQNSNKHMRVHDKFSKPITLICPICTKKFERAPNRVTFKINKGITPCCSRQCGGIMSSITAKKNAK